MFKLLEPKTRFIRTAAVFIVAVVLLGFGILRYALPAIVQESDEIKQTKTNLAALEEKKTVLFAEEKKIKLLSEKIDTVNNAIVPANNPVAFFGLLEQLAAREHLSIEIKPASAQNAPPNTLALVVSVTGALKQGVDFVKNIPVLPFVTTVSDVALSRNVTVISPKTNPNTKIISPILGETTITITLFAASRP